MTVHATDEGALTDEAEVIVGRIAELLVDDPLCSGRVTAETVLAITDFIIDRERPFDPPLPPPADLASLCAAWVQSPDYAEMTTRQLALLAIICDQPGPHRVRHLAAAIGAQKPVITRALKHFEQLGLVGRRRDPDDARDRLIAATKAGLRLRDQLRRMA